MFKNPLNLTRCRLGGRMRGNSRRQYNRQKPYPGSKVAEEAVGKNMLQYDGLSSTSDHRFPPISRTARYKKITKPLLERKRRARMNKCYEELKTLMAGAFEAEGENLDKLEKAEILEMTVRHLQRLSSQPLLQDNSDPIQKFQDGFTQCASEACSFLLSLPGLDNLVGKRLINHLQEHCAKTSASIINNNIVDFGAQKGDTSQNHSPILTAQNNSKIYQSEFDTANNNRSDIETFNRPINEDIRQILNLTAKKIQNDAHFRPTNAFTDLPNTYDPKNGHSQCDSQLIDYRNSLERSGDHSRQDHLRRESQLTDLLKQDHLRRESQHIDTSKQDHLRRESQQIDALKQDYLRRESHHIDASKQDHLRRESQLIDLSRQDHLRRESQLIGASKNDQLRSDQTIDLQVDNCNFANDRRKISVIKPIAEKPTMPLGFCCSPIIAVPKGKRSLDTYPKRESPIKKSKIVKPCPRFPILWKNDKSVQMDHVGDGQMFHNTTLFDPSMWRPW